MKGFTETFLVEVVALAVAFLAIYAMFNFVQDHFKQDHVVFKNTKELSSFILSKAKNCYGDCYYGKINVEKKVDITILKKNDIVVERYEMFPNRLKIRKDDHIYVYLWSD